MSDGDGENVLDSESDGRMPWTAYNPLFTYVKQKDEKNFIARCKLCLPVISERSCGNTSSANLKSHLKRKHNWTDKQIDALSGTPPRALKRKSDGTFEAGEASTSTEGAGDNPFKKRNVRQDDIYDAVDKLIINETLPHRIVDSPYFKNAVLLGLSPKFTVGCRQSFRKRLNKHFETMRKNLIKELNSTTHVACFADCWSKFRRSFLGVTATWLDHGTMERKIATLALKRLKHRHTYDVLAKEMNQILEDFQISGGKTVKCTTDSASNFGKAFRNFQSAPAPPPSEDPEPESPAYTNRDSEESEHEEGGGGEDANGGDDEDHCIPVSIEELCQSCEGQAAGITLPPHQRCASHIMQLIATTDAREALQKSAAYKKVHDSADEKLKTWWSRQGRSDLVASTIQAGLGVKFEVPGETRWNSEFDAKKQVKQLHEQKEELLSKTLDDAGLPKLSPSERRYLREYVWVMEPVAFALDVLQRDHNMYLGFLLPTVAAMERNLKARATPDGQPLKYCEVLRETLLEAIRRPRRFGIYLKDEGLELHVAATLIPCFKLSWIENNPDIEKDAKEKLISDVKTKIVREIAALPLSPVPEVAPTHAPGAGTADAEAARLRTEEAGETEDEEVVDDPGDITFEDAFFGINKSRLAKEDDTVEGPAEELNRYLKESRKTMTIQACFSQEGGTCSFPRLRQLFQKYNTALPSSASVERFFSTSGHSFSAVRNVISDETLEMEVMLKVNSQYWR